MSYNRKETRRRVLRSIGGVGAGTLALSGIATAEEMEGGNDEEAEPEAVTDSSVKFRENPVDLGDSVVLETELSVVGTVTDTNLRVEVDASKFEEPTTVASNVDNEPSAGGTDGWELGYSANIDSEVWRYDSGHLLNFFTSDLYHNALVTPHSDEGDGTSDAYGGATTTVPSVTSVATLVVE